MNLLRDGSITDDPRLDRLVSGTSEHIEKYPLRALQELPQDTAMEMGVNWYANFDDPLFRKVAGRWRFVIGDGSLGRLRGGHATALRPWRVADQLGWWRYYNQGEEGRCVEFGGLRMMSLLNRKRYDITSRWHYWQCQMADEWPGGSYPGATPQYEGTSVRAMMEVLRTRGAIPQRRGGKPISPEEAETQVSSTDGILAYRWATTWDEVRQVLGVPDDVPGVPMLNSWGSAYPHETLLLDAAGERLLREDGEFGVATDR